MPNNKKSKALKIILVIISILLVGGFILYYIAFGLTPKQKYQRCTSKCKELVFQESSKALCEFRCSEITKYDPRFDENNNKRQEVYKNNNSTKPSDSKDIEYYCEWSWPQKIIDYKTKEVIVSCPSFQPYCFKGDGSYEKMACCNLAGEKYYNCSSISELLE